MNFIKPSERKQDNVFKCTGLLSKVSVTKRRITSLLSNLLSQNILTMLVSFYKQLANPDLELLHWQQSAT